MDDSIIILDSEDEDTSNKTISKKSSGETIQNGKRQNNTQNDVDSPPTKQRRVQPQKIGEIQKTSSQDEKSPQAQDTNATLPEDTDKNHNKNVKHKNEPTKELEGFIHACRKAENNSDMKKIIKTKLLKYYDLVHPEFARSKHLRKMFEDTALAILRDPKTVYSKLQDVINELKSRKNCGPIVAVPTTQSQESNESKTDENGVEIKETGDEKQDSRLRKLNKALTKLKQAIEDLEEAEVNFDDEDDSPYLKKVRYEKRAVEIYNKICEITGESSHAHRIVKHPIKFKNTKYKEFNKRLSKRVNRENGFPCYYDVCRLLDFCNKEYKYGLIEEEVKRIAEAAFVDVGKLLKERRRNDLYETAEHYAGKNKDPAKDDSELKVKLEKNEVYGKKRTDEIFQLFVNKQLNGDTGECDDDDDDDYEMDENTPSTSKNQQNPKPSCSSHHEANCPNETQMELKSLPTQEIMSIIDIKTECDINGEKKKDAPVIDLTITL